MTDPGGVCVPVPALSSGKNASTRNWRPLCVREWRNECNRVGKAGVNDWVTVARRGVGCMDERDRGGRGGREVGKAASTAIFSCSCSRFASQHAYLLDTTWCTHVIFMITRTVKRLAFFFSSLASFSWISFFFFYYDLWQLRSHHLFTLPSRHASFLPVFCKSGFDLYITETWLFSFSYQALTHLPRKRQGDIKNDYKKRENYRHFSPRLGMNHILYATEGREVTDKRPLYHLNILDFHKKKCVYL